MAITAVNISSSSFMFFQPFLVEIFSNRDDHEEMHLLAFQIIILYNKNFEFFFQIQLESS